MLYTVAIQSINTGLLLIDEEVVGRNMRVLISCKQHVFSQGLIRVLKRVSGVEIAAVSSSGVETLQKTIELKPNIIFIDEVIQDYDIIELSRRVKELLPEIHIVIVMRS